ncbi:MAG: bifunctional phosphopantothenoylcysteine decarboxylase/phosphopantothenate--cysteine ligase CoaBC [Gemmatimonadetes bacterium]|nr:MAG: bifunctional phosphopantothenoylcysteine decarboxylase/phosphopantothenate--cysteine ligase CoaBC [Gemmatimonadota bacterium]
MLQGRRVLLGVSGGIASYKSCILARLLTQAGARVSVVLTRGAAQFVGPVTFEALTGQPVLTSLWQPGQVLNHVRLPQRVDLIIVAPATAHLMSRAAQGLADDLLTTMLVARTAPLLLAPAMNDDMYQHPAVQDAMDLLAGQGAVIVGPAVGDLAEGPSSRPGRMVEPETIFNHSVRLLRRGGALDGLHVVVTAGPTRESIDPVRFVSNRSSGRMGYALAQAAWWRGATVTLIAGPSSLPVPDGPTLERVETTADMAAAVATVRPEADVLIMAAAPSDYRPGDPATVKRPRADGDFVVTMEPTADILMGTAEARRPGSTTVGFALETGDAVEKGRAKLVRKDLDMIVINDALEAGAGFEVDTNRVTIIESDGRLTECPLQTKVEVAEAILDVVERHRVSQKAVSGAAN